LGMARDSLKDMDDVLVESMWTAAQAVVTKQEQPFGDIGIKEQRLSVVKDLIKTNPMFQGLKLPEEQLSKNTLQQDLGTMSKNFYKMQDAMKNAISISLQEGPEKLSKKEADLRGSGAVELMGLDKVDRAISQIRPYAMSNEQFLKDSVFGLKQKSEELFQPGWFKDVGGTQKGYESLLKSSYQQQLLFSSVAPISGTMSEYFGKGGGGEGKT